MTRSTDQLISIFNRLSTPVGPSGSSAEEGGGGGGGGGGSYSSNPAGYIEKGSTVVPCREGGVIVISKQANKQTNK